MSGSPLRLDLGSGPNPREGFIGVDVRAFPRVQVVADLRERWPWPDGSVAEVHCSHFLEHLDGNERIRFANELYRVLVPGGIAKIITPHWASSRAYGDLTHKWPPVAESWYPHLSRKWREENAPHEDGYACDFDHAFDFGIGDMLAKQPHLQQVYAVQNFKDAVTDLIATITRR